MAARKISKAGREAIGRAARKRWAAYRKAKKAKKMNGAVKTAPTAEEMEEVREKGWAYPIILLREKRERIDRAIEALENL